MNILYEPILFTFSTLGGTFEFPINEGYFIKFEDKEWKANWCRLKYRVYNKKHEVGGYSIDIILKGDMDEVLSQIENLTLFKKSKSKRLKIIQYKTNNKVPEKYRYKNING